jgi:hypothetical protein
VACPGQCVEQERVIPQRGLDELAALAEGPRSSHSSQPPLMIANAGQAVAAPEAQAAADRRLGRSSSNRSSHCGSTGPNTRG